MNEFVTPPNHEKFLAKKLFESVGEIIVKKDESFLVDGKIPHSVWNNHDGKTVMIGISVK